MFGLCLPTGDTYLIFKNGKTESIMLTDETEPKKFIMNSKYVLEAIKYRNYKDIEAIVYEYNNHKTVVSMAEYYYENADKLERED